MPKSIYRDEYGVVLRLLKAHRVAARLTQAECFKALGRPQSFVSDVERGVRRLDVVQLRDLCGILNMSLRQFVAEYEAGAPRTRHLNPKPRGRR